MDVYYLLQLSKQVLLDRRVIFITILTLVVFSVANYVVHYRRKPPVVKQRQRVVAAPAPAPEAQSDEDVESGDEDEE